MPCKLATAPAGVSTADPGDGCAYVGVGGGDYGDNGDERSSRPRMRVRKLVRASSSSSSGGGGGGREDSLLHLRVLPCDYYGGGDIVDIHSGAGVPGVEESMELSVATTSSSDGCQNGFGSTTSSSTEVDDLSSSEDSSSSSLLLLSASSSSSTTAPLVVVSGPPPTDIPKERCRTTVSSTTCHVDDDVEGDESAVASFAALRLTYLVVTLVIMLADGLQGTHLYVLYEGYGYSVASLYGLGFITGGIMSPLTGPLVDRIGRKKAAILYCVLEIFINQLEQYPLLPGLIASRMIGGFTTNLLNSVFETWLDTEYRRRKLAKEKYEVIMRDSVIVSNVAAIFSGYLAHVLAENFGACGPFRGAVFCTTVALLVVSAVWTENYGGSHEEEGNEEAKGMREYLCDAVAAFKADNKMLRIGITQGLSEGSIHIFIFLWSPALAELARSLSSADGPRWGLDSHGEPAYGIIFGAFMAAGVLGGLVAPCIRQKISQAVSPPVDIDDDLSVETVELDDGEQVHIRPMAVELLAASCYLLAALLLLVPCVFAGSNPSSFTVCIAAFVAFELLIGVFLPCEGVIRSLYFPAKGRASVMALPRLIVNGAVSLGVVSTNFVSLQTAFAAIATLMVVSAVLQLSLVSRREWTSLFSHLRRCRERMLPFGGAFAPSFSSLYWEIAKVSESTLGGLGTKKKCKAE